MWASIKEYGYQLFVAEDQRLNVIVGGTADETFSSRCYRTRFIPFFDKAMKVVDFIFQFILLQGPDHCKNAYIKEVLGRHLSQRFYDDAISMNIRFDNEKLGKLIEMPK